jgi:hypothetical protein
MAPKHPQYTDPSPPHDLNLPTHWSLARAPSKKPKEKKPPLPRQNSSRMGTSGPPGCPEHYGRELGSREDVPPGQAGHREINNTFFQPPASNRIEDHPDYPGKYAGEYKPGLRPQQYPKTAHRQDRAPSSSQGGQAQRGEAPAQEKEGSCCVIL